ncbi:hypothetical protein HOK00_03865 [bacterium]|nr:hypothetical protein [bacterium]
MYHCKDLNNISFSNILWNQINNKDDIQRIKKKFFDDLVDYYKEYDSFDVEYWRKYWK